MTTNAYSGFKFGRFWDKIPDFNGRKQKVWYPPNGKPPMHLVCIVFWPAMRPNGPKMPIFGQKSQFWAHSAIFGPKILILMGVSKSFGTNITENHLDNLSALFFGQALDQMGQKCRYLAKNASFGPNLAVFGPKIQFLGGRE